MKRTTKKVEPISAKELTKNLINGYTILNGAENFSSGIFQNFLVFIPDKKHIIYFNGITQIYS